MLKKAVTVLPLGVFCQVFSLADEVTEFDWWKSNISCVRIQNGCMYVGT